ncbi:MAG: histidine kinase [Syntrophorhabdaceae bacterium]|nr:histidine kinase [Syntrophorhabdaceae bacterium]
MTYRSAKKRLKSAAKMEMERTVALIAQQNEIILGIFKTDLLFMADMPLIKQTAGAPDNDPLINETCRYFQIIVERTKIFQSINLFDIEARCIASSFPNRINLPLIQQIVLARADFHAAVAGKVSVSQILISQGTGRPAIAISVPVRVHGRIVAVLRAVLDLDYFNNYFLHPQQYVHGGKAYFFDPQLDTTVPEEWNIVNVIEGEQYKQPEIPIPPEMLSQHMGVIRYSSKKGVQLAAFCKTPEPEWFFVVERPKKDVLEPIRSMGYVTAVTLATMLFVVSVGVSLFARPLLKRLGQCMTLAQELEAGHLDRRLKIQGRDEVARLARGLNAMAESLEDSRDALEEAERLYRGIFENAVEGIFVTNPDGLLLNANPAFAQLLGYDSPSEIIGTNVTRYYSPERRTVLLEELRTHGTVKNFEITFHRRDGTERIGSLYVRADRDSEGRITRNQGIGDDITEQKQVEEERRRAEEAQRLFVQSQLEALRYQINPHFLFNVLNSLIALSESDPGRITGLIYQLSSYLRSTLTSRESGLVPLAEELAVITSYLNLEKVRFEDDLAVSVSAPDTLHDAMIPELLIQPLVENAVKHGMKTSRMPLEVDVSCRESGESVEIVVSNTGRWIQGNNENGNGDSGIGLENIRKRLDLTYGDRYRLYIGEKDERVRVTIEIPRTGGTGEKQS